MIRNVIEHTKKILNSLEKLDLLEINYSGSNFSTFRKPNNKIINIIFSILSFILKQVVKDIFSIFKRKKIKNKNLLFYNSDNQYNALLPIHKKLDKTVWVTLKYNKDITIPMSFGCILSLLLTSRFIRQLTRKYKNEKDLILNNVLDYYFIEGMYIWWSFYLYIKKPRCIIFSNDHLVWHRVLRIAAQVNNIPTVYLQHASVTNKFPKLEFDLSLLEGEDAFKKYAEKKIYGNVKLVGMPKFDKYYSNINENSKIHTIGICTNLLDDEILIETFCKGIRSYFDKLNIILRPHPRDFRYNFYQQIKTKYSLQLSDSTKENSFEYLDKVDINIAGETSIHLEAALLNVYPIYFQFRDEITDHYGFIKNKLITDVFDKIDVLVSFLYEIMNKKPNIRERAKFYVESVNSEYDGKSIELAKKNIENYLKNEINITFE